MKLIIASDIHGDYECAKKLIDIFFASGAQKLLLLGDILYHGPRNDLPKGYAPKQVISLLNPLKDKLLCVRGNCDTEVDQMVLNFPILADYAILSFDGLTIYATHGHIYNETTPPPLASGDILLHGHTHVIRNEKFGNDNTYLNPGSITFPKESCPRSYMIYENRRFAVIDFDGSVVDVYNF